MKKKLIILLLICIIGLIAVDTYYLNQPANDYSNKEDVSIAITGDVMFARKMPGVLDLGSPFRNVEDVVSTVDLLLINFENPATYASTPYKGAVPLKSDPKYVGLAKANENTIAALANNHIGDYGPEGLKDTINALDENGISYIGAGNNLEEASKPVVQDIKDRKVVILNYMDQDNFQEFSQSEIPIATENEPGYSPIDWDIIEKDLAEYNDTADIIIVYLHYGNEYSTSPNENQVNISKKLIDNGADIVVGAHPHVTQGIEMYNDKPIFYSLGNFIFDQSNPNTHLGMFLELDLVNDSCEVTVYPIYINGYIPQYMSADEGANLLNGLNPQCDNVTITENGTGKLVFKLD
ncbi:CapA family protein [Methanobrevibacter sp. DSM 116169]|uniref:CapA family protein n=1 Tax=Methanobrevibacter sp. DSM 116169 TaxID=3242727 RepID=UPI0038FD0717